VVTRESVHVGADYIAAIAKSSQDAIVGKDLDGNVTFWNASASRLFGYSADEIVGRSILALIPSDRRNEESEILTLIRRGESVSNLRTVRQRKDGCKFEVTINVSPILDEEGRLIGAAKTIRDVTITERAEHESWRIIDAAPIAMLVVDASGSIALANAQTESLLGYSKKELLGMRVDALLPERLQGDHRNHRAAFMKRPEARAMGAGRDLFARRKDGAEVPVEIGLTPLPSATGIYVVASIVDLTDRKRAEERLRLAVECSPTAIITVNRKGVITLVNAQTEVLFGYPREELIGKSVETLVPRRFRDGHAGFRAGFLENPQARGMGVGRDLHGLKKDGTEVPVEIGLNPIESADGPLVMASIIDISKRKRAEYLLAQQREELERSNKDLEQFAYVASHDLQEPLRAVAGCVQLLQKHYQDRLDPRADQFIGHTVDGCQRMQSLIDDLLTFSRVGRGGRGDETVDCEAALAIAIRNLSVSIAESGARITSGQLPPVKGDPPQMATLFQNLIGNAIKFRRPGAPVHVQVGAVVRDVHVVFSVADNGIGIASEHFERIFGVFQRLHTRREYPGTGIGLALCKRIVECGGGRIWLESQPGDGTTFFFTLPLASEATR
jgi:PAS domain S-box-containing protein